MNCVYCGSAKTSTNNSRSTRQATQTWRRKYCKSCKRVFTTFEKPDMKHLAISHGNSITPYRRSQLYMSIARSFQAKIDHDLIDKLVDTIEVKLIRLEITEITSQRLAEINLQTLKPIDKKAYLHYLAEQS